MCCVVIAILLYCSITIIIGFYSSSYVHHRDLHSFPTRRSSDLGQVGKHLAVNADLGALEAVDKAAVRQTVFAGSRVEDRKSTRLNSSHVAISYAVFCLKKKKR